MECTKEKMYFLIESLRRCNYTATKIHTILMQSWPDQSLSVRRIQELCKEFKEGNRCTFSRIDGSGRNYSDERYAKVEEIKRLIDDNNSLSTRAIARTVDITQSMAQRILSENLEKVWIHTRWVPHQLTPYNKAVRYERCQDMLEQMKSRLTRKNLITIDEKWIYLRNMNPCNTIGSWVTPGGDSPPVKTAKRTTMEAKVMFILALSQTGHHYFEILRHCETINSERYVQFLRNLENHLKTLPQPILFQNVRLIQDNARPHVSAITTNFLIEKNVRLLKQPPYSPDCNLCDCYAFPRLESVRKSDFVVVHEIHDFLNEELPKFTALRMEKALKELEEHMERVIAASGDYVIGRL